jgi:hypothetical protein
MIFLDLDNTLIHSVDYPKSPERIPILVEWQESLEGFETYYCQKRPFTEAFLKDCRSLAPTKLLTSSVRNYAYAHNKILCLGFSSKDIYAREDFLYQTQLAYGSATTLTQTKISPSAVLIDDLPPSDPYALAKQRFLGIPPSHYFQIREYQGGDDPEIFGNEIKILLENIKSHLQTHLAFPSKLTPLSNP